MKKIDERKEITTNSAGFIELDIKGEFTRSEATDLVDEILEEVRDG